MKAIKNLAIYSLFDILGKSILLIVSPFLTRLLSSSQYGAVTMFAAIWGILAVLQFGGMDASYQMFRAQTNDENERARIQVTATYITFLCFSLIWGLFLVFSLTTNFVVDYIKVSKFELFLFLLGLIPSFIIFWTLHIFRYMHLPVPFVRINLLGRILSIVIALPFMFAVLMPDRLMVMLLVVFVFQSIFIFWIAKEIKEYRVPFFQKRFFSKKLGIKMFNFGIRFIPSTLIYSCSYYVDRLLAGYYLSPDQAAIAGLAIQLAAAVLMVRSWFSLVWDPMLVEWISTKNPDFYIPKLKKAIISICVIFYSLTCLIEIWGAPIIEWIYPEFYKPVGELIAIIALSASFSVLTYVAIASSIILNTSKFRNTIYTLALLVNIGVIIILMPKLKLMAVVLGGLASEVIILLMWIVLGKYYFKNLNLDWFFPLLLGLGVFLFIYFYPFIGVIPNLFLEKAVLTIIICSIGVFVIIKNDLHQIIRNK